MSPFMEKTLLLLGVLCCIQGKPKPQSLCNAKKHKVPHPHSHTLTYTCVCSPMNTHTHLHTHWRSSKPWHLALYKCTICCAIIAKSNFYVESIEYYIMHICICMYVEGQGINRCSSYFGNRFFGFYFSEIIFMHRNWQSADQTQFQSG